MQAAKNVQDAMSKLNALERRHQEDSRQAVASKEPEFVKMKTHGISVCIQARADVARFLLYSIVKELNRSTNIDFEKGSYSENQGGRRHTHITSIEMDKSQGDRQTYGDKSDEDHCSDQHCYQDEEGGLTCFVGKTPK